MIARDSIFSLLQYDRIFGKKLEARWGKIKFMTQRFAGRQYQICPLECLLVFFMTHVSSYNIFET